MTAQGQVQTMEAALEPTANLDSNTSSNISPNDTSKTNFDDLDFKNEACPFSFQKKPIRSLPNHSVISDMIPHQPSIFGDTPGPSGHAITRKSLSLTSGLSTQGYSSRNPAPREVAPSASNTNLYNHIDYDEQIRAPRMSNINYYTYGAKEKPLKKSSTSSSTVSTDNDSKDSVDGSKDSVNGSKDSVAMDDVHNDTASTSASLSADKQYLPANFDLSQPTRRFSAPSNADDADSSSTTILSYTTNNYIYERNNKGKTKFNPLPQIPQHHEPSSSPQSSASGSSQEQEKLLKAIDNLNKNTTTKEKQASEFSFNYANQLNYANNDGTTSTTVANRIKNRTSNFIPSHLGDVNGTSLQQVYELKKPLIVPAVLRPITSADSNDTIVPATIDDVASQASDGPSRTPPGPRPGLDRANSSDMGDYLATPPGVNMKPFPYQFPPQLPPTSPAAAASSADFLSSLTDIFAPVEPTHKHWKPNSFTDHCMKCFDTFGTFFLPQRKRRHHCRFCGLIFCMSCLYKNPEIYGEFEATTTTETTIRSIMSNSSLNSNNGIIGGGSTDEYISGVMMDKNGRLVVPIFKNLMRLNSEESLTKDFKKLFKFCKICKDCGSNYLNMMQNMNTAEDFNSPFIFIENVYLKKMEEEENQQSANQQPAKQVNLAFQPNEPGFKEAMAPERQASITQVPSDWTWSSF